MTGEEYEDAVAMVLVMNGCFQAVYTSEKRKHGVPGKNRVIRDEVVHGVKAYSRCKEVSGNWIVTSREGMGKTSSVYVVTIFCASIAGHLFTR